MVNARAQGRNGKRSAAVWVPRSALLGLAHGNIGIFRARGVNGVSEAKSEAACTPHAF